MGYSLPKTMLGSEWLHFFSLRVSKCFAPSLHKVFMINVGEALRRSVLRSFSALRFETLVKKRRRTLESCITYIFFGVSVTQTKHILVLLQI